MTDLANLPEGTAVVSSIVTWIPSRNPRAQCSEPGCRRQKTATYFDPETQALFRLCRKHAGIERFLEEAGANAPIVDAAELNRSA